MHAELCDITHARQRHQQQQSGQYGIAAALHFQHTSRITAWRELHTEGTQNKLPYRIAKDHVELISVLSWTKSTALG